MRGVEGFTSGLNQRMSAEMKRTNREGAESFRVFDEMIGLHLNRPLTRLIVETFPNLAHAFSSALGGIAFGAVGFAITSLWEDVSRKIDEAKKKQEEFAAATLNVQNVIENAADAWALKIAALGGKNSLAATAAEGAAEARRQIDELGKAIDDLYKKKVAAENWMNKLWAETAGEIVSTPEGKTEGANKQQFGDLQKRIDEAMRADTLNGTTNAMKVIGQEIDANTVKTEALKKAMAENEKDPFAHPGLLTGPQQMQGLQSQRDFLDQAKADEAGREKYQGLKDAKDNAEAAKKAIHDLQEELKTWNQENNRAVEAWMKLNEEIDKSVQKLNSEAFKEFNKRAESQRAQFAPYLTQKVAPPPGAPMLPDQAELAKVTADQNESWRKAGEILAQIETPAQKYATGLATIRELQAEGRLTAAQMAQATQLLDQQMVKAADHVHQMQEEMLKLLERSDSARDGLKAFFLQLEINGAENGKFAFSFASTMFKDFEDGIAKTILATRNQHAELRRMWEGYFKGLEEMAIKFSLTKSFASLANLGSPAGGGGGGALSGIAGLLAKLFGMGGGAGGATTAAAGGGGGDLLAFAEGGDATPGSSFISGEAGAERVDLTRGGGARITPLGGAGGSQTTINNDFRGTVMTDDLMRRAEAMQEMRASEQRATARAVSMSQEIAKRSRPAR